MQWKPTDISSFWWQKQLNRSKYAPRLRAACANITMNREPIHQNLSTSFVDLAALVQHLRDLQFLGSIHVELSSYDAEIVFTADGSIHATEYDHLAGRTAHGKGALKRIFGRSREPFGRIHVYRTAMTAYRRLQTGVYIDEAISARARDVLTGRSDTPARHLITLRPETENDRYKELIEELLETILVSLNTTGLDFPEAFRSTCGRMTSLYPFLDPKLDTVKFQNGKAAVAIRVGTGQFTDALAEVLGVLLGRIARLPSQKETAESVRLRLRAFVRHRSGDLERCGLRGISQTLIDII